MPGSKNETFRVDTASGIRGGENLGAFRLNQLVHFPRGSMLACYSVKYDALS